MLLINFLKTRKNELKSRYWVLRISLIPVLTDCWNIKPSVDSYTYMSFALTKRRITSQVPEKGRYYMLTKYNMDEF